MLSVVEQGRAAARGKRNKVAIIIKSVMKKPQSQQKEVRPKVNSGIQRNLPQPKKEVRRVASAVQPNSAEKLSEVSVDQQRNIIDKLNNIVQDYLVKNKLLKTLDVFEQEIQFMSPESDAQYEAVILAHFDRGERELFLNSWSHYIPLNYRQDHDAWKLEFYIQIYFLIYPIHPSAQKKGGMIDKQQVNAFKAFLDSKGSDLSKTNEVIPFYALPYVKNPQSHQSFQHLFTREWVMDLRDRLKEYIRAIFGQSAGESTLKNLYMGHYKQGNDIEQQMYLEQLADDIKRLTHENNELKRKVQQQTAAVQQVSEHAQHNLMETQQKWFQFMRELMSVSNQLLNNVHNPQIVANLRKKIQQYEHFLSKNIEDLMSQSQDISLFEKASLAEHDLSNITSNLQAQVPVQQSIEEYMPLDYPKIIKLFTTSTNHILVASVLQALRWRITRARSALERRSVVVAYSTHDIIGTHQRNIILAQYLMLKAHQKISCQTLKLLNALASDYSGRSYLTTNQRLIQFLVDIVKKEQGDTVKRKNAIGALQKLSLRKQSQNWMLDNDVIYHTLMILKNESEQLSEYTYEYITALIMNLSLSSRGKDALSNNKDLAFEVLFQLIEYPNDQIRTFTNGTFYSMFSRKELRDYAYQCNIPQELPKLLHNSDERFKKQIQYMITQLESSTEDDFESSQMDEDNDVDDIDDEEEQVVDDEEEEDLENNDMVIGEELLKREFGLQGDEGEKQKVIMNSIILKEYQQRSMANEQLRESQIERMPAAGQLAYYNEMITDGRNSSLKPKGQKQTDPAFVSRPKIPRTPPVGSH